MMSRIRQSAVRTGIAIALTLGSWGTGYAASSAFGCAGLETNKQLASVEGRNGFFYRVIADLRMEQQLSEHTADQIATIAEALEAQGTTLVYVPIPTKSLVLPQYLPATASSDFGFDYDVAKKAYEGVIQRLREHGIVTVDLLERLKEQSGEEPPFFQADFHWTSAGARASAGKIAEVIRSLPGAGELQKADFETRPTTPSSIISTMRRMLQASCTDALPLPRTQGYETVETDSGASAIDIFGSPSSGGTVALVGTSYSDLPASNFAGFLSQALSTPVTNYSISGGNQFGSITSYLTSEVFQANRPRFLIWENPIYNNLGKFGDAPLIELATAARQSCRRIDPERISPLGPTTVSVALEQGEISDSAVIYAFSGDTLSRHATLSFKLNDGHDYQSSIVRADRMVSTGRFYFPVRYFASEASKRITLEFDRLSTNAAAVSVCHPKAR